MSPRNRKLVGGMGMVLFVIVYALVAMTLADSRPVQSNGVVVQVVVYIVLGLVWILPVMPLIVWMEGGRRRQG